MKRVAVIGGGLAGLSAAIRLAEEGWSPIVIETSRRLGGRATSFDDPRSGRTLDNCQHVAMGCCTNLVDFYERLGVLDQVDWHRETWWAMPPGRPDRLGPSILPAPMHFAGSFLRMRSLSLDSKISISRAMLSLIRIGFSGRDAWCGKPFTAFLEATRQSPEAITRFWEPIIVSACNLELDEVAANLAIKVFQDGFLAGSWQSAIGVPSTDLRSLYDPAERCIRAAGGEIRQGVSAHGIAYDGTRVTGVVTDDGMVHAGAVVSAVPPDRLAKLVSLPMQTADNRLQDLEAFSYSPIVGVHLFFDAPVMLAGRREIPFLVLPGRPTQWLFNKGREPGGLHHVHAVSSAAESWMGLDEKAIAARVIEDVHWALPTARGLDPVEVRSVKEKRATFRATPESDRRRPNAGAGLSLGGTSGGVGISNLFLAGDWCNTGWPATMEGAVRSGYAAAAEITGAGGVVPDVPVDRLPRWLGLR